MSEVLERQPTGIQQRTDWFAVITELQRLGIPMRQVGTQMGNLCLTESILRHYRAGIEPIHWRGQLLLDFWCKVTGKHMNVRPMTDVSSTRDRLRHNLLAAKAARHNPPSTPARASEVIKRKPGRPKKAQG